MATSKLCGFQRRVKIFFKNATNKISKYCNMIELQDKNATVILQIKHKEITLKII